MEIIPVIDLLHGKVVRAQRGERSRYLPIRTSLCNSSEPTDIAEALLGLYPFKKLYIADLDAILGSGNNAKAIKHLKERHPTIEFWVDCGIRTPEQWASYANPTIRCIIGSEVQNTLDRYQALSEALEASTPILSLDFSRHGFMGPPALQNPQHWSNTLICMTLGKVGSYEGPDFERLNEVLTQAGKRSVFAAGGIRNAEDLHQLQTIGVAGALIASTLHDGRLSASEIASLQS